MSAPSTVKTNGIAPIGIGGLVGVQDEVYTSGATTTIFAVTDLNYEPKRTHIDTKDADDAITMRKSVTPMAVLNLKGKMKSFTGGLTKQEPGTSITTTISGASLAVANLAAAGVNGFVPTDGLLILNSIKFSQKRLDTQLECDLTIDHLPHAA
jgi:hypothetical protein